MLRKHALNLGRFLARSSSHHHLGLHRIHLHALPSQRRQTSSSYNPIKRATIKKIQWKPYRLPFRKLESITFVSQHHIRKLSRFGSVLREDFSSSSDIDLLVEFEPHHLPGYLRLAQMELELSEIMGWKVDLRTPAELSRYFRQDVLDSAQLLYDKN